MSATVRPSFWIVGGLVVVMALVVVADRRLGHATPAPVREPAWPKIEALTDAARNGLITRGDYERKVTELVGGSERKAAVIRKASETGSGRWTAAEGRRISALSDALTSGAITEEQFDAQVAEFSRERQVESAGTSGGLR